MVNQRVVLYARLSIANDESVSIARQLESGRALCALRGWTIVAEHVDDGVSASANKPEDRVGWQAVLAHPPGTYDLVLIWKVDRLARKVLDFLHANDALKARGAALAAVDDPIDMSTAQGEAFAIMLAVFGQMEAEAIRARVKAARRALIKDGRVPGGAAPFGYWNAPNPDGPGKVLMKSDQIAYVVEAAARALRGESIRSIATYLDTVAPRQGRKNAAARWTVTVTKRMLSNPIMCGWIAHNPGNTSKDRGSDVLRDETGLPIVREDLAVMSVEEYRHLLTHLEEKSPRAAETESYLSGLVWCGACNAKMYRNAHYRRGARVRVFQCQSGCGQQVTNLEQIVEDRFIEEFGDTRILTVKLERTTDDYSDVAGQIADTVAQMQEDSADVMALAERLKALKEMRKNEEKPKYRIKGRKIVRLGGAWADDPREALTLVLRGVQLVKGGVGRKFDQNRLSFLPRDDVKYNKDGAGVLSIVHGQE